MSSYRLFFKIQCIPLVSTGLSKRDGAKFSELGLDFPKLADWLCMGRPSFLAAIRWEFSNRGTFLLLDPVHCILILSQDYGVTRGQWSTRAVRNLSSNSGGGITIVIG